MLYVGIAGSNLLMNHIRYRIHQRHLHWARLNPHIAGNPRRTANTDDPHQLAHRWRLKHIPHRNLGSQRFTNPSCHPGGRKRVAAQVEEGGVCADRSRVKAQHFSEYRRYSLLVSPTGATYSASSVW